MLLVLLLTCVEVSIASVYFQLNNEDYRWWWRAFLTSGSSGIYLFFYSLSYKSAKLEIDDFVPTLVYVSYMLIVSLSFFLMTGAVGLLGSLRFVRLIYGSVKVD